jgi:2-C-methyl-D-erythritol 4-phosphate cytidylyltransferase
VSTRFLVILPAAGASTRYGTDKLDTVIAGRRAIEWSIDAFLLREDVTRVMVATRSDRDLPAHPKLCRCEGGTSRADTVRRAVEQADCDAGFVAIHDAARPAVGKPLIDRVFTAAIEYGAAVPGLAVTDTIKRIAESRVVETLPRPDLVAVQTPQAMRRDWLMEAFRTCPLPLDRVTDDVQLLELAGRRVQVVDGEPDNLKLTRRSDGPRLEAILASRRGLPGDI